MVEIKKSKGGYVPAGPMRWERARLNAEKNPTSKAAKLYRARLTTAMSAAGWCDTQYGPTAMVFTTTEYTASKHYVCSTLHAAMLLQLRLGTTDEDEIRNLCGIACEDGTADVTLTRTYNNEIKHYKIGTLAPLTYATKATCRVCAEPVWIAAPVTTSPPPVVEEKIEYLPGYIITDAGQIFPLESVRFVSLTDEEYLLLNDYSTPPLRWQYGIDYGEKLEQEETSRK